MELRSVGRVPSPAAPGQVGLAGEVAYDDRVGKGEEFLFDVPEDLAPFLSRTGKSWFARPSRTYVKTARLEPYYELIRSEAEARGRTDIVRATERAIRRSRVIRRLMAIPNWLSGKRGLWRVAGPIRRTLLEGEIV